MSSKLVALVISMSLVAAAGTARAGGPTGSQREAALSTCSGGATCVAEGTSGQLQSAQCSDGVCELCEGFCSCTPLPACMCGPCTFPSSPPTVMRVTFYADDRGCYRPSPDDPLATYPGGAVLRTPQGDLDLCADSSFAPFFSCDAGDIFYCDNQSPLDSDRLEASLLPQDFWLIWAPLTSDGTPVVLGVKQLGEVDNTANSVASARQYCLKVAEPVIKITTTPPPPGSAPFDLPDLTALNQLPCNEALFCGDGRVDAFAAAPEECDDGNGTSGDGCSSSCKNEGGVTTTTTFTSTSTSTSSTTAPTPTTTTTTTSLPGTIDCSGAAASPAILWPPNHRLVSLAIGGLPAGVTATVTGVSQDEPVDDGGDGHTCPDAAGIGTSAASVRAERSGGGDGRVYRARFAGNDGQGGTCTGTVAVCVPHDRHATACVDSGAIHDSAGPCPAAAVIPPPERATAAPCRENRVALRIGACLERALDLDKATSASLAGTRAAGARGILLQMRRATRLTSRGAVRGVVDPECASGLLLDLQAVTDHFAPLAGS